MSTDSRSDGTPPASPAARHVPAAAKLHSPSLFGDRREVVIVHNGEEYRLRITRQDKLILTK